MLAGNIGIDFLVLVFGFLVLVCLGNQLFIGRVSVLELGGMGNETRN